MIEAAAPANAFDIRRHRRAEVARSAGGERAALVATAVATALLPLAIPTGPANTAPIDLLLALAVGACLLWATSAGVVWRFPYVVPVGLAIIGGALAAVMGPVPGPGVVALAQDVVLIAWCWAVANLARSATNLRILLAAWTYGAIGWVVAAFVGLATGSTLLTGQIERQGTRLQLTLADPSYTANYFFVSMMIMWATQRPTHRLARYAAYGALIAGIAATGSNSGLVAVVFGGGVAALLGIYRRHGVAPAVAVLAFALLGAGIAASTVNLASIQAAAHDSRWSFVRQGIGRSTDSAGQRQSLLHESVALYERGNPLGEGPVSTKPRLDREMAPLVKEAHNDYLAALVERGPIGFAAILLLVSSIALRGLFITRTRLSDGFAGVVRRPNALVGAVAGTLVGGLVYELLHVRHVWALFAIIAAVSIWGRE